MKKIKSLIMAAGLMVAVILWGAIDSVMAITTKISVSPMVNRIILTPGEHYQGTIDVSNPASSESDLRYIVEIGAYSVKSGADNRSSYDEVDVETKTTANMMMDWITLGNESGVLASGETVVVTFDIDVPEDAPAGGQYATLLVHEDKDVSDSEGAIINETAQLASIIYAQVAGETDERGEILENNVPTFVLDGHLEATSIVENNGNIHTDAEYAFQVFSGDKEICATDEDLATSIVMPGIKRYHQESCELPSIGMYKVKQTVKIFGEESTVEKTVLYCPIWLVLIVVFVVALVIIWLVAKVAKKKK